MAFRTWGRVLLVALGVGVLAGAGQLGFAYGFGIVRFARTFDSTTASQWTAQLAWVSWFTMVAAVVGAVIADRLARRYDYHPTLGTRLALAGAAALGGGAVAPLSMQPARAAQVDSVDPVLAAGLIAGLGALVGFAAAVAALHQSPVSWNVAFVTGGIWVLALISVMPSLGPTDPLPAVRLGVPDPTWLSAGSTQRLAVVTMPALALVAGALTGALARMRGHSTVVVASAGAVGPAMLALAYLAAGPGDSADKYQAAPYWGALVAVAAGALGSVLAAVMRWPLTAETATPTPLQPTEILQRVRTPEPAAESPSETWTSHSTDPWTDRPTEPRPDHLSTTPATAEPTRPWDDHSPATPEPTRPWDDHSPVSATSDATRAWKDNPTELWAATRSGAGSSDPAAEPVIPSPRRSRETDTDHSSPATPFLAYTPSRPLSADYAASKPKPAEASDPEPVDKPGTASKPASPTRRESTNRSESTDPGDSDLSSIPTGPAVPASPISPALATPAPFPSSPPAPSVRPSTTTAPSSPPPLTPTPPPAATPQAAPFAATTGSSIENRPTTDLTRPVSPAPAAPIPAPAPRSSAPDPLKPPTPEPLRSSPPEPSRSPKSDPFGTTSESTVRRPEPEWADPTLATMSTADFWPSSVDRHKPFEERTESGWDAFAAASRTDTPASAPEPTGRASRNAADDQDPPRTESRQPAAPPEPFFKAPEPVATSRPFATPEPLPSSKPYPTPEPLTSGKLFTTPEPLTSVEPITTPEPIATGKPHTTPEPVTGNGPSTPPEPVRKNPFRLSGSTPAPMPPTSTAYPTSTTTASPTTSRPEPTEPKPDRTIPGIAPDLRSTAPPLPGYDHSTEQKSETKAAQQLETTAAQKLESKTEQGSDEKPEEKAARPRRGLFRRNRSSGSNPEPDATTGPDTAKTSSEPPEKRGRGRTERPVPATDEEYVDWVSGLGAPTPAEPTSPDTPRRTLRSPGRHHAD
ncbi:hypothetical protein AB0J90_22595 [Micromonospora sp. NPDC049523]|uniref:phage holin family protein n=1 Tax=Micromonospora sp. NPDC049523 TaxID=3155921 RepID=UPI003440257D